MMILRAGPDQGLLDPEGTLDGVMVGDSCHRQPASYQPAGQRLGRWHPVATGGVQVQISS